MVASPAAPAREDPPSQRPPRQERRAKITPLPLSQMIPMTFVIVNESICGTMLMPFVGPFVAFMQGIPVNEAGYYSGVLIGMFMLGQVVSAKTWGRISDKYGRRFPIISGLFTSGLMMLGFGLSTSVWMCAVFRFFHGLFNGNILVAKTMMADITDKTNQGGGFSFISLCSAFGFLIGPALGGLFYDPAHSDGMQWAHINAHGFFSTHPAFLPSLIIFVYTNIGMLVCTFLVKESNPHAQPLPGFMRLVYPCFWYKAEQFVLPPLQYETEEEDGDGDYAVAEDLVDEDDNAVERKGAVQALGTLQAAYELDNSNEDSDEHRYRDKDHGNHGSSSGARHPARSSLARSPPPQEMAAIPASDHETGHMLTYNKESFTSPVKKPRDDDSDEAATEMVILVTQPRKNDGSGRNGAGAAGVLSTRNNEDDQRSSAEGDSNEEEAVLTRFGYREAFARPYTRFMLSQYMVLSATDMVARDSFPLWAVATASVGGLGLTSSQVSYILLANSAPCLLANILFRYVERYFVDKMGLLRVGVLGAGIVVLLLPFNSYLGRSFWTYVLVFLCTGGRQLFCSWCYSLNTMLTARSAPPGHVGSIMGINQSCGALVRGIVPFVAAPAFAWSISGEHFVPFNHVFVFVVSALMFFWCWWRSYSIRTDAECNLHMMD